MIPEYRHITTEDIDQAGCSEDFHLHKHPFHNLCKAKDIGCDSYVECLEEHPFDCKFSFRSGYSYYCRSPLRVYVVKKYAL
jgi:hypothetical protein